jgi:xanthine dehydrogenase accessory factor
MGTFRHLIEALDAEGAAALVTLVGVSGSSPREPGARLVVRPSGAFRGTIGGGRLEYEAIEEARRALLKGRGAAVRHRALLGPDYGQCCGGRVDWLVETFDGRDLAALAALGAREAEAPLATLARRDGEGRYAREPCEAFAAVNSAALSPDGEALREVFGEAATPVWLFGAGHVGRALALALAPLPFALRWIDSRDDAFPTYAPANATRVHAGDPVAEMAAAPEAALVLIMTHSHALDFDLTLAALSAPGRPYVGLIGSQTKRARFVSRLRATGLDEAALAPLVCPIGVAGVEGKAPAVIAAATTAQLLMRRPVGVSS